MSTYHRVLIAAVMITLLSGPELSTGAIDINSPAELYPSPIYAPTADIGTQGDTNMGIDVVVNLRLPVGSPPQITIMESKSIDVPPQDVDWDHTFPDPSPNGWTVSDLWGCEVRAYGAQMDENPYRVRAI